jgi:2-methylcitrate dehydratase PrpD
VVDAQFSMPFGAAVAVLYRAARLDQFIEANVLSDNVRKMMGKVGMNKDARIEKNLPGEWPALVTITLRDGRTHEKRITHPKGDPQNPLTWDELKAKFKSLTGTEPSPRPLV